MFYPSSSSFYSPVYSSIVSVFDTFFFLHLIFSFLTWPHLSRVVCVRSSLSEHNNTGNEQLIWRISPPFICALFSNNYSLNDCWQIFNTSALGPTLSLFLLSFIPSWRPTDNNCPFMFIVVCSCLCSVKIFSVALSFVFLLLPSLSSTSPLRTLIYLRHCPPFPPFCFSCY